MARPKKKIEKALLRRLKRELPKLHATGMKAVEAAKVVGCSLTTLYKYARLIGSGPSGPHGFHRPNLTGREFADGGLTVRGPASDRGKDRSVLWICDCRCGGTVKANTRSLLQGRVLGCADCRKQRTSQSVRKIPAPEWCWVI